MFIILIGATNVTNPVVTNASATDPSVTNPVVTDPSVTNVSYPVVTNANVTNSDVNAGTKPDLKTVPKPGVTPKPSCHRTMLNCRKRWKFDVQLRERNLGQNAADALKRCNTTLKMVYHYANQYLITPAARKNFTSFRSFFFISRMCDQRCPKKPLILATTYDSMVFNY